MEELPDSDFKEFCKYVWVCPGKDTNCFSPYKTRGCHEFKKLEELGVKMGIEKVVNKKEEWVFCDYKECPDRGDYVRCYFDIYKLCPSYIRHKRHLNELRKYNERK